MIEIVVRLAYIALVVGVAILLFSAGVIWAGLLALAYAVYIAFGGSWFFV